MEGSRFDMVVLGSGPAGQKAAIQAAKVGASVAVVERRDTIGGVCANTGTIPSKTLRGGDLSHRPVRARPVRPELPGEGGDHDRRSHLAHPAGDGARGGRDPKPAGPKPHPRAPGAG